MRRPLLPLLLAALAWAPAGAQTSAPALSGAPDLKSFQQLEDKWSIAYAARDQYGMEVLLSPVFVDISAAGQITARNGLLANMVAGTFDGGQLVSIEQKAVDARSLGPDAVVVDGTYLIHYKAPVATNTDKGAPAAVDSTLTTIDERGVFSHIWQRTRLGWACSHSQRTAVFDQPLSAYAKPRTGKKSDAELPFHIPLVYQGAQSKTPPKAPDAPPPQ